MARNRFRTATNKRPEEENRLLGDQKFIYALEKEERKVDILQLLFSSPPPLTTKRIFKLHEWKSRYQRIVSDTETQR